MAVWYCIPSKRPAKEANECLKAWRDKGYLISLFLDHDEPGIKLCDVFMCADKHTTNGKKTYDGYPGYAIAVNDLIQSTLRVDPSCDWVVTGGDDVWPDPNNTADEIARECSKHFCKAHYGNESHNAAETGPLSTFGVMQPTGDRWGEKDNPNAHKFFPMDVDKLRCGTCGMPEGSPNHCVGAYIDRVCGSPWIGREFARRMYQGKGPYWPEYTHMGVDEELFFVAKKYGVLWQRPDLTHFHAHWGRPRPGEKMGMADRMPEFLAEANSPEHWRRYKRIFSERQSLGFPGSEPL